VAGRGDGGDDVGEGFHGRGRPWGGSGGGE
jgi:hypothetical protein